MIPLPRASVLAGVMIVGVAVGLVSAIAATAEITATVRPDIVIALVVGIPSTIGMLMILLSGRRWITALGAMILAIAPGWFGALAALQVASGV